KAVLVPTDANLRSYGLPEYLIEVTFPSPVPTNQVKTLSSYTLTRADVSGKSILLKAVHIEGGAVAGAHRAGDGFEPGLTGSSTASAVSLVPIETLEMGSNYTLTVTFSSLASPVLRVVITNESSALPAPDQSQPEVTRIFQLTSNVLS